MPDFPNPFSGNVDRKVNKKELVQALRVDIDLFGPRAFPLRFRLQNERHQIARE